MHKNFTKNIFTFGLFFLLCTSFKLFGVVPPELQNLSYGIYPTSVQYNTARFNHNKRFNIFPQAIFTPTQYSEVAYVLGILKQRHLHFSVRSGAHCHEPGSLSSGYVIDLRNFNSIIPDTANNEVFIGAGCILSDVINTLGQLDYAIPTGTCPSVGATGLTLGGGIGLLGPAYGLTCDSVKSITLLTADLNIIEVNEANYPDLFWALRGGGNGSYGIVLGITFTMYYIPEVSFYELIWEWDAEKIIPIMEKWQTWVKTLPDSVSSVLGVRHPNHICAMPDEAPPLVIRVFGLKVGSEPFTEWENAFQCLNPQVNIFQGRYVDISKYWATESPLPFNKSKSRILMEPVTKKVMKQVDQFFRKLESHDADFLVYFNFEAFGGKIAENETAFFPRDAFGWWYQTYYWQNEDETQQILSLSRDFYAKIPKEVSNYCYANIVDYDLGKRYLQAYYGDHVDQLICIKNIYDPTNLFHWKQSIPTDKESDDHREA